MSSSSELRPVNSNVWKQLHDCAWYAVLMVRDDSMNSLVRVVNIVENLFIIYVYSMYDIKHTGAVFIYARDCWYQWLGTRGSKSWLIAYFSKNCLLLFSWCHDAGEKQKKEEKRDQCEIRGVKKGGDCIDIHLWRSPCLSKAISGKRWHSALKMLPR